MNITSPPKTGILSCFCEKHKVNSIKNLLMGASKNFTYTNRFGEKKEAPICEEYQRT